MLGIYRYIAILAAALALPAGISAATLPLDAHVAAGWASPADADRIATGLHALFDGTTNRIVGSVGNRMVEDRIIAQFQASGFPNGSLSGQTPCFIPGTTSLVLPDGRRLPMLPMHPGLFRPGNLPTPATNILAVYVGPTNAAAPRITRTDTLEFADGLPLKNAIVVQEYEGKWQDLQLLGPPEAYVFIGADPHLRADTLGKLGVKELRIPRFYLPLAEGDLLRQALLQSNRQLPVRIESAPSRWESKTIRHPWVFIPGADPSLQRDVILITAPLDANGVVPDLAQGGMAGANLLLLTRILERARSAPPARSIMLAAVNARTQFHLGDRLLAWHLLAPGERLEAVRDSIVHDFLTQELLASYLRRFHLDGTHLAEDDAFTRELRTLTDRSLGSSLSIKEPLVASAKKEVNRLRAQQVALARRPLPVDGPARAAAIEEMDREHRRLEDQRRQFVNILSLFNKFGTQTTLSELAATSPESLQSLRDDVTSLLQAQERSAALNRQELQQSLLNEECRRALGGRHIAFVLSLEFDGDSPLLGLCSGADWGDAAGWQSRFGRNTVAIAARLQSNSPPSRNSLLVDTMTRAGGLPEGYYFPAFAGPGPLSCYHRTEATPAFAFRNVFATYARGFTPDDTFSRLNTLNLAAIDAFLGAYLPALLADPTLTSPNELPRFERRRSRMTTQWSGRISTRQFDEFAADVMPTLLVPNSMVIVRDILTIPWIDPQGTIPIHMSLTDERATTTIYGLPWNADRKTLLCDAFHYDPDFIEPDFAVDAGDVNARVHAEIRSDTEVDKTLALFPCREFPVFDRVDSSLLSAFPIVPQEYLILSASRNAAPRRFGFYGATCLTSSKREPLSFPAAPGFGVYVEPGERLKLVTRKRRALIHATADEPTGGGYASATEMAPGFFDAVTRDLSILNHHRLSRLRGVSDELAHQFLERGDAALARMRDAYARRAYTTYSRERFEALGAQAKAYAQTASITNDMLKAVIFYMALMIPFSFFLQRLLFKTVRIEAQMGLFVLVFILTFIVFRTIHPAFRITQSPEAMFVAFVMGGLALFVMAILRGRFEGEMQLLFQTYTGMDTAEVAYSTAGQQALLIGVQNMKRRRIRTLLTTATIVLVTFTMLAFSSISKTLSPTVIPIAKPAPYSGIFYHWPAQVMDGDTATVLHTMFGDSATILQRLWALSPRKTEGQKLIRRPVHIACPARGTEAQIDAILGLQPEEDGFIARIPLLPGGRFFSASNAREVIVTRAVADQLAITPQSLPGAILRFMNEDYAIVGILDDARFADIRDLDGRPLLPIQVRFKARGQEETTAMGADLDQQSEAGTEYVSTSMLLLMPAETLSTQTTMSPAVYSLSIRFPDHVPLWPHVERLLTATDARFFVGTREPFRAGTRTSRTLDPGIYYMGTGYRTSIGGLSMLIIPLLIASTIILNTMLGSVYERKAEIAVYNAVGLNPNHIGLFFLAEAFVYSVIGSVGGYLIGQILSMLLGALGLVRGINLNFSSLNVVYVIAFTVAIVMLSTLYPAYLAARAAVPSGKRKWSIPPHDGDTMDIAFPFIYPPHAVAGVLQYVHRYLSRFTEAALGDLLASCEERSRATDPLRRTTHRAVYLLALAPFDLGVTQRVTFTARYDDLVRAYRVHMRIERLSGQDTNWEWTNRPFLERLRQHLMRWRNLTAAEHAACAAEADAVTPPTTQGEAPCSA